GAIPVCLPESRNGTAADGAGIRGGLQRLGDLFDAGVHFPAGGQPPRPGSWPGAGHEQKGGRRQGKPLFPPPHGSRRHAVPPEKGPLPHPERRQFVAVLQRTVRHEGRPAQTGGARRRHDPRLRRPQYLRLGAAGQTAFQPGQHYHHFPVVPRRPGPVHQPPLPDSGHCLRRCRRARGLRLPHDAARVPGPAQSPHGHLPAQQRPGAVRRGTGVGTV
ncbi:MAG: SanA protein, partial [uncultured Cytophagales bacterium]